MVYSPISAGNSRSSQDFSADSSSLGTESELLQFAGDSLSLAAHMVRQGQVEAALSQYQNIMANLSPEIPGAQPLVQRATDQVHCLTGSGGSTSARAQMLADQFLDQLFDPVNLAAFGVAAGVRTGVKTGVQAWLGRGAGAVSHQVALGRRILPGALAFVAEVPAFVGTRRALSQPTSNPWGPELLGTAFFLGSLQLGQILSRPLMGWMPPQSNLRWAVPALAQYSGIYVGQYLEQTSLGHADLGWDHRAIDSFAIFMQLQALGRLAGTVTSGMIPATALRQQRGPYSRLDPALETVPSRQEAFQPSELSNNLSGPKERPVYLHFFNEGRPREGDIDVYRERMRDTHYGEGVAQNISSIESGEPFFAPRWLDVFTSQSDRGSYSQILDTDVLSLIYRDRPLETSLGSWQGARLQAFIGEVMRDPDLQRGRQALFTLHGAMQAGLSSAKLEHLSAMFRYDIVGMGRMDGKAFGDFIHQHRSMVGALHRAMGTERANRVTQFIFRESSADVGRARSMMEIFLEETLSSRLPEGLLGKALDGVQNHSLHDSAMRRIFLTLATNGLSAKLAEIALPRTDKNSFAQVAQWARQGLSVEEIASRLDGTEHMGFIRDTAVSRKMAEVLLETGPYLTELSGQRNHHYSRLYVEISQRIRSGQPITSDTIMELLALEEHPQVQHLIRDWLTGDFDIVLLEPKVFDARVSEWGQVESCPLMFFDNQFDQQGRRLVMRQLPRFSSGDTAPSGTEAIDISSTSGMNAARLAVLQRLYGTIHEYQHFLDLNAESGPPMATRHNRVVTEMTAFLEEFRWRARNTDLVMFEYARRQGVSLGTYLRDRAERNYFSQYDHQVARKYFPDG